MTNGRRDDPATASADARSIRHLELFLTEACNLACRYCFAANRSGDDIDPALALRAVELLLSPENPAARVSVAFWGGEPLLRFRLLTELVERGEELARQHAKRVSFAVPTNLTPLDDAKIDFLQAHAVRLSLSCDGAEAAQGERRTHSGGSSFELVRAKLELVARRYGERPPPVRMTVTPANAADLEANVRFFLERGFRQVELAAAAEARWSDEQLSHLEAGQLALADLWADELRAGRRLAFVSWDKELARREALRRGRERATQGVVCGAGDSMLAVDVHGDVYPCHRFVFYDREQRGHRLGSIGAIQRLAELPRAFRELRDAGAPLCPALNHALSGDPAEVPERLRRLARVSERVVDQLEARFADEPWFRRRVDELVARRYRADEPDEADVERLAARAAAIIEGLPPATT